MASDALRLLFELDVDSRSGTAGLLRFRKDITATVAAARRAITQPFNLPPIKLPTITSSSGRGQQFDTHVKEFRHIEAEAKKSARIQEREQARLNSAVQSLQRQRSAALIRAFKEEERAAVASSKAQERAAQQAARSITNAFRGVGSGLQSIGRTLTVGLTAPLLALGAASLKSAKDIDANVNTLKAFTGSAEAAERRLAQLIKTSRGTPGLTTNLAATLDAQLRTAQVTEETIDRVLPAIGRLNAVSKLPDAGRFTQNLLQLVTQNFEKQDLKELVGQSPLAGQLLTQIFNVDSPTNAKAIRESAKKLGLTTVDSFINAFAEAAARNQGLATVTESIGTRFDKIVDRVSVALRPLGLAIINAIEPFVEPVARLIERIGAAFDSLSAPVKTAVIAIAGIAAVAGPVLFVLGGLVTTITAVVTAIGAIASAVAAVGLPVIAAAIAAIVIVIARTVAILALLGLAWKTNFLNVQGLVTDAADAVLEAFDRIKAVIDEATQRILPTLQSITTKILGAITFLWERYGKAVVAIVGTAFRFITSVTEIFLRTFTDFIDLVLKLVDGNWQGAWSAFARIALRAIEGLAFVLEKLPALVLVAFVRLHQLMVAQAVKFALAGEQLAIKLVVALAARIIKGAPAIRDALVEMLTLAVSGLDPASIAAVLAAKFIAALQRAAAQGVTVPVKVGPTVGGEPSVGAGLLRQKRSPTGTDDSDKDKGADAATRRRIRLLEIEAEKVRTLTDAQLAREQIAFDERKKSLEDYTNDQIKAAGEVLLAQLAVYKKEREEAKKIRNESARNLALAEIGQKEFEVQQAFTTKVAQLEAGRRREELEAVKSHRQALLDIQEQADAAELARIEDFQRQGHVTPFDVANRRAEIEAEGFRRRKGELEAQQIEAGKNLQEQQRITDELNKLNDEAAESVRRNERLKREAIQETADAYRDYTIAIREAFEVAADASRNAAAISLSRLTARVLLTDRQRIERQFVIDRSLLAAEKRASDLRIDNAEREAIEKAKRSGDFEEKVLQIQRTFSALRLAEKKRFLEEERKLEEDKKADIQRSDPNSTRSLFGDTFADFGEAIRTTTEKAGVAISNIQVVLGSFGAAAAEHFAAASASAGNFVSILLDGVDAINAGLADMLQNWVLTGEAGSGALRKLLASTLTYYAKTFLIKALDNVGEGFSNLAKASAAAAAGNIPSSILYHDAAIKNFLSAAKYGLAAAGAAVAGRVAAGDSFKQKDTASRAINGGTDAEPRNRAFNGQLPVESSSQAAREGSGGFFGRVFERIEEVQQQTLAVQRQQMLLQGQTAQALTRIQSMPHGQALAIGAAENPAAVGQAVVNHSNSSGDFNETLQRNLGFA